MAKVKSLADLKKMKEELQVKLSLREKSDNPEAIVQIKVAMATCGIASGAKTVMETLIDELDNQAIEAVVTQTGCMGYCYAEPTIEVKLPQQDAIVFGYVDAKKAREIVTKYVKTGELVDGIIPVNYQIVE
jgi:NADP-reducing hydrogenase subunit HndB